MIISELNYIESVDATVVGGTGVGSFSFDKNFNVKQNISANVDLNPGEFQAVVSGTNRAKGDATFTETDFVNFAGNGISQSDVTAIAAAQNFGGKKY